MRIVHLTDLHLRRSIPGPALQVPRRSREVADLLVRALADTRERQADVVVLTGDLVDVPPYLFDAERDPAADAESWRLVREDYRWLRRTLDDSGVPWVVVPGNHDSYRLTRDELGGPMVREIAGVRLVSFWDREHESHVPQRILADRRRFEAVLADPDPMPQVHLQHFVIAPERNDGYPTTYLESAEMVTRLAQAEHLTLTLSGHHHPGAEPEWHGNALFSITPAFTEAPHPYRVWDIELDPSNPAGARVSWEHVELGADQLRPAVFLDRDGCLNTLAAYHSGPEAMELLPGAALALRRFREAGFQLVVVTNQSAVGLGYVTPAMVAEVNDRMHALLAAEGAWVDAVAMSFAAGTAAVAERFRSPAPAPKPCPEMLRTAAATLAIDLDRSYMIGDRESDIAAGRAAGVTPVLVRTGAGRETEPAVRGLCLVVDDLLAAAVAIYAEHDGDTHPGR